MPELTPGLDGAPVTDKHRLIQLRSVVSDVERGLLGQKLQDGWGHVRPYSVLVAVIGNHYKFGSWQRIIDMIQEANKQGIPCAISEIQDRCFDPYDALGTMRNEAILAAQTEGFEFLCYVDADIQPAADTLVKLMAWQRSPIQPAILAPFVIEEGTGRRLHGPSLEPYTGLHVVKWCVLSMLLFRTSVFNCTGPRFWGDAMGADEGYHFQTLYHYGHRPYIDTNVQLPVAGRPHYPLATNRFNWQQRQEHWDRILQELAKPPDRRPIDPNSPYQVNGEYLPFLLAPQPPPAAAGATVPATGSEAGGAVAGGTGTIPTPMGLGAVAVALPPLTGISYQG